MITQKIIMLRSLLWVVAALMIISYSGRAVTAEAAVESAPASMPSNVFSTASYDAVSATFDDFDFYVPYRSDAHDKFSWQLLKTVLQEEHQKNVIISPFSVKLVLAVLSEAAGINTQTQKELFSTLTDIKTPENLRGFYKKTLSSLKKTNPYYTLNLETKLYTDSFIEPQQRYTAILKSFFDTEIQRLNFAESVHAADTINAWCSNVTHGHLRQLVTEDSVQSNVMLMANVIYFNGLWRREFNTTFDGAFFHTPKIQKRVQYMEMTDYFYYYESRNLSAKILRLPYKGKKFSMFIVLPEQTDGIDKLTGILENDELKSMQWRMEEYKVKVTLPKFKFEYKKDLKETLKTLGINDIFTENASLPGLARGADVARRLKVSNVYQKAGIDVNERGTEAFAATVIEIDNKFGGASSIEEFNVNHPFIFFIEEEATGNIIFAGKVLDPTV